MVHRFVDGRDEHRSDQEVVNRDHPLGHVARLTDDFSTDRLALCDISLRAPFSFDALRFALREAVVNNAVWQKRQRDQAQAAHPQV